VSSLRTKRFAVVGAGNIGKILLSRLLASGVPTENLMIYDSDVGRASDAASQFGVHPSSLSEKAADSADVVLAAVPPKSVLDLLAATGQWLRPGQLVISFAAAIPLSRLESVLPPDVMVARVMPNAPSLVGQGMNPVAFGQRVTPEGRALVEVVLDCLGETIEVNDGLMNWCVGLSGAAMRSLLPALEGMTQAGIEAGLSAEDARRVAAQAMLGTAAVVLQTELSFEEIKSLTPMQTVDEAAVAKTYLEAARAAKEKIDQAQRKIEGR